MGGGGKMGVLLCSNVSHVHHGSVAAPPPGILAASDRQHPSVDKGPTILAAIVFLAVIVAYFLFIHAFGVNVVYRDQWSDVQILGQSLSGHLTLGQLWAQHNEERLLFPNLIVVLLGRTTHFNIVYEEYVGAVLLVASIALLILAHRRRARQVDWLWYCPVALLMLSMVQYESTLWGFQLAWYLVLAASLAALFLLDRLTLTWPTWALAIVAGVVASFSSIQGLIVWPVGLILLLLRHRSRSSIVTWIACSLFAIGLYFADFSTNKAGAQSDVVHHPVAAAQFYLALIGDVVGAPLSDASATRTAVELLGLVILLASAWAIVVVCRGRAAVNGGPIAVSLIGFGLLFAVLVTGSRSVLGISAADGSRYRTFDLLIVVGLYLVTAEGFADRRIRLPGRSDSTRFSNGHPQRDLVGQTYLIFAVVVVAIVCFQVALGIPEGLTSARNYHATQVQGARVLANINDYPDAYVASSLGAYQSAGYIREMARILERHRLSLFASGAVAQYQAEGLIAIPPATIRITSPRADSVLHRDQDLLAAVSDDFKVTKVEFEVTGQGLDRAVISTAASFLYYGWIGEWKTQTVANGSYELQGLAFDSAGHEIRSPEVSIIVRND